MVSNSFTIKNRSLQVMLEGIDEGMKHLVQMSAPKHRADTACLPQVSFFFHLQQTITEKKAKLRSSSCPLCLVNPSQTSNPPPPTPYSLPLLLMTHSKRTPYSSGSKPRRPFQTSRNIRCNDRKVCRWHQGRLHPPPLAYLPRKTNYLFFPWGQNLAHLGLWGSHRV